MAQRKKYWAALYTRKPRIGEVNLYDEADYDGYTRVPFWTIDGKNCEDIIFPMAKADYDKPITYLAALDKNGVVIAVMPIKKEFIFQTN